MDVKRVVDLKLTPREMAVLFASMNSDEQAEFFNYLAEHIKNTYPGGMIDFQLAWVISSDKMTQEGLMLMETIRAYGVPSEPPKRI